MIRSTFLSSTALSAKGITHIPRAPRALTRAAFNNPHARNCYFTPEQISHRPLSRALDAMVRLELDLGNDRVFSTGFLISDHGHIATAGHALKDPGLDGKSHFVGTARWKDQTVAIDGDHLLYRPPNTSTYDDLAILHVPALAGKTYIRLAEDAPPMGTTGALIGYPQFTGMAATVTLGVLLREETARYTESQIFDTGTGEVSRESVSNDPVARFFANVVGDQGNSGSPFVDMQGRLLGMGVQGTAFATELARDDREFTLVPAGVIFAALHKLTSVTAVVEPAVAETSPWVEVGRSRLKRRNVPYFTSEDFERGFLGDMVRYSLRHYPELWRGQISGAGEGMLPKLNRLAPQQPRDYTCWDPSHYFGVLRALREADVTDFQRDPGRRMLSVGVGKAYLERYFVEGLGLAQNQIVLADQTSDYFPRGFRSFVFNMYASWPTFGESFDLIFFPESFDPLPLTKEHSGLEYAQHAAHDLLRVTRSALKHLRANGEIRFAGMFNTTLRSADIQDRNLQNVLRTLLPDFPEAVEIEYSDEVVVVRRRSQKKGAFT